MTRVRKMRRLQPEPSRTYAAKRKTLARRKQRSMKVYAVRAAETRRWDAGRWEPV